MANDLFIPAFFAIWLFRKFSSKESIIFPKNSWLIFAFAIIGSISLLFASLHFDKNDIMTAGLYLFRWIEYASLFFISFDLIKTNKEVEKISWLFILSGFFLALFGFVQYVIFPDFSFMVPYGWDPHLERLVSTFFDPNFTGMYLVIALTLIISIFYSRKKKKLPLTNRKVNLLTLAEKRSVIKNIFFIFFLFSVASILALSLILTYSRSSMLALLIVLIFIGILRDKKIILITFIAGFAVLAIFPRFQERLMETFDARTSANKRIESWTNATTILQNTNLAIGIGYNTYRPTQIEFDFINEEELARSGAGTDSSLLLILVTTGIVGFLIYVFLLIKCVQNGYYMYLGNYGYNSAFGLSFTAIILALLMHSQFVNSLLYPFLMIFFWIGFAIVTKFSEGIKNAR